ncbi:hypothetical protein HZB60_04255 [candidate division KSB1 bacterium]|nr:hypothetical protein [candidate division KSB1 bacterium]
MIRLSRKTLGRILVVTLGLLPCLARADGLLRIGLQLHNEPQTNRPCTANGEQDYLSTCVVMDSLMTAFARHGAKITFEMGLGNALSTPVWGGAGVRGSVPYMVLHPEVICVASHIHYPADMPGFRDKFCPPFTEDNIAEASLTYAQYALSADRRRDVKVAAAGQPIRGVCGLWSRFPTLRWVPALSATGYEWVTGWNNVNPPGGSTGGHAWATAVNPWRVGHDLTNDYRGGVLDSYYNGAMVLLPDGAVSGRMNPNEQVSFAVVDSLMQENWLAGDPERINVCYLTVHDYEFKSGGGIDYAEFHAWDSLLTMLDGYVSSGQAVYQTMDEMYQDFVAWEGEGNISYPHNGTFEARDTVTYWTSPDGHNEVLEYNLCWSPLGGTVPEGDGQDPTHYRHGRYGYRFGDAATMRGIGASTEGKHIYCVVPADTSVEFRVWCYAEGAAQPLLGIRWYASADTTPDTPHLSEVTGAEVDSVSGNWSLLVLRADVPAGATALRTCLYKSGDGSLWYDDANLRYGRGALATPVLTVGPVNSSQIQLHWTAVPGATGYRLHYDTNCDGSFTNYIVVAAPGTSATLEISAAPVTFYKVYAVAP